MTSVHHIALRVRDCALSASFYVRAFGLKEFKRIEEGGGLKAVWLRADDLVLMLERGLRGEGAPEGSGHVLIFHSSDLSAAEKHLKDLRIGITDRTPSTLYVEDPDGHRAGLSSFRFDPSAP